MKNLSPFALKHAFIAGAVPHLGASACWFIFARNKLLVELTDRRPPAISPRGPEEFGLKPVFSRYLGSYAGADCFVATLDNEAIAPPNMEFRDLRSLFGELDEDIFCLAGRAIQIIHWHREHQFCGKCGTPMVDKQTELARHCPNCIFVSYPRLSPAVIMSVIRGDRILLARSPRFSAGMYSTLAGFVEPGETLEEAVYREVFEEVGVFVDNIRYVASQPWPFPHSLMIGFATTYKSGDIHVDNKEIEDAGWFSAADLPVLPSKISISRLLIDNFLKDQGINSMRE
ncbi:MAG: NAD(+) diphosphatase [Desulforhopalus sp.]|nr:NAD(+) diphosphatase [Desulforhopalus sp.]